MSEETIDHGGAEVFEDVLGMLILDGAGPLIGLIATFVILIAGVRLFRSTNAPGVSHIFYSMVLAIIGFAFPIVEYFIYGEDGSLVFSAIFNIYGGLVYLLGAYGFWRLAGYVITINANKALKSGTPESGAP